MTSSSFFDEERLPVIPLRYKNLNQLYKSFMPFVKNGGLFIPTAKPYHMGQEVLMLIRFPNEDFKTQAEGVVVWITPMDATNHKKQGVGIEFSDENGIIVLSKIKALLSERMGTDAPTYTL